MKITKTDDAIYVSTEGLTVSKHTGFADPEVRIINHSDGSMLGSTTKVALDASRLDEYIEALTALQGELVAASPRSAADYVEERELGGDPWREGRSENG